MVKQIIPLNWGSQWKDFELDLQMALQIQIWSESLDFKRPGKAWMQTRAIQVGSTAMA